MRGKVKLKKEFFENVLEDINQSIGVFLDVNSLYAKIHASKLPIGDFIESCTEEINKFDIISIYVDGDYYYALLVKIEILDHVKICTDDLPLSMKQQKIPLMIYLISRKLLLKHHNLLLYKINLLLQHIHLKKNN